MGTFWDLLPYRLEQRFVGRVWRSAFVMHRRRSAEARAKVPFSVHQQPPQIFVDMAVISQHDAGTGIQRVVRELALALLKGMTSEWDVKFVSATRKRPYHTIIWPKGNSINRVEMRANPGDVFLGLDYSLDAIRQHGNQLRQFRRDGGSLWFLVHDLLPFQRPEWFSRNTVIRYKAWLGILSCMADGFLCNSLQTESELKDVLATHYGLTSGYRTQVLPMGYAPMKRDEGDTEYKSMLRPNFDPSLPFTLMIGTLEPRKGHADIIAAFDELWRRASSQRLVLVGRMGWKVDDLRDLILAHPEYGKKFLWFDDVGDEELFSFYENCSGVIIASYGEGFGLPVIEALSYGKPVLARDLAVFRIHEGKGVTYFPVDATTSVLSDTLAVWLTDVQANTITVTRPTEDWSDSAAIMLAAITSHH